MVNPDNYPHGYPGPGTPGNIVGAFDKIGLHFDQVRQNVAQAALRGELVDEDAKGAMRVISRAELAVRQEHETGQRINGCVVINLPPGNRNPEAQRLFEAWMATTVSAESLGGALAHLADAPDPRVTLGSRILHLEMDGTLGEFDGMIIGRCVGESFPGFEVGDNPILLIPEDRLAPTV